MPHYLITLTDMSRGNLTRVLREHKVRILDHGRRPDSKAGYSVDAIVSAEGIKELKAAGYKISKRYDVEKIGKDRQREVGQGNRYEKPARRR